MINLNKKSINKQNTPEELDEYIEELCHRIEKNDDHFSDYFKYITTATSVFVIILGIVIYNMPSIFKNPTPATYIYLAGLAYSVSWLVAVLILENHGGKNTLKFEVDGDYIKNLAKQNPKQYFYFLYEKFIRQEQKLRSVKIYIIMSMCFAILTIFSVKYETFISKDYPVFPIPFIESLALYIIPSFVVVNIIIYVTNKRELKARIPKRKCYNINGKCILDASPCVCNDSILPILSIYICRKALSRRITNIRKHNNMRLFLLLLIIFVILYYIINKIINVV